MEVHDLKYETKHLGNNKWELRWYCEECDREVVYDPYQEIWVTLCKGDQSVTHHGSVGGLQFSGHANNSVPPQFEEFLNGM